MEALVGEILFKPRDQWDETVIAKNKNDLFAELATFERYLGADGFLAGAVGAADFTLYPLVALSLRLERAKPDLAINAALGPKLSAWMRRVEAPAYFARTVPPHWKEG
jgi:glutathione S-transferase